jgi:DNA-binding MarR family transcriptional regulator
VFGHAGLLLLESVEAALEPHRMQMRHVAVMLLLESTERPMSQQELSKVLKLDPTRMVAIVDRLEELGYAERNRNPTDRRRYTVTLTRQGRKALEAAMEVVDEAEAEFFAPLEAGERSYLDDVARRLMAPHWVDLDGEPDRDALAAEPA